MSPTVAPRLIEGTIASTRVDAHGLVIPRAVLETMAATLNDAPPTVNVEHNPLFPTIGRLLQAWVAKLPDSEYSLQTQLEIQDVGSIPTIDQSSIVVPTATGPDAATVPSDAFWPEMTLKYDPRVFPKDVLGDEYRDDSKHALRLQPVIQKSEDLPLPILQLVVVGGIPVLLMVKAAVTTFASETTRPVAQAIGKDVESAYRWLSNRLQRSFDARLNPKPSILIVSTFEDGIEIRLASELRESKEVTLVLRSLGEGASCARQVLDANPDRGITSIMVQFVGGTWKLGFVQAGVDTLAIDPELKQRLARLVSSTKGISFGGTGIIVEID